MITEAPMKSLAKGSHITGEAKSECLATALVIAASSAVLLDPDFFIVPVSESKPTNLKIT